MRKTLIWAGPADGREGNHYPPPFYPVSSDSNFQGLVGDLDHVWVIWIFGFVY